MTKMAHSKIFKNMQNNLPYSINAYISVIGSQTQIKNKLKYCWPYKELSLTIFFLLFSPI